MALCAALLSASAAYAQTLASTPTINSINFRTGDINFTAGSCGGSHYVTYRYSTSLAWMLHDTGNTSGGTVTVSQIADRDYVEVRLHRFSGTGCARASAPTATVTYTAVTVASNRVTLSDANLHGAELTVTLGADHAFGSSVGTSSFQLVTSPAVSGLSISAASATSGARTATLTLGFTGYAPNNFTVRTSVLAAAHNGGQDLTSLASAPLSVMASGLRPIITSPDLLAVNEGASASYTVELRNQPSGDVAVAVASDHADVTVDVAALTFTMGNWDTAQTVTATAAGDVDSADERAILTHSASGYAASPLVVAVQDDEQTGTDYDSDEDGLIEVGSLAQLNAIRWDLDGDGAVAAGDAANYGNAFSNAAAGMGCPDGGDSDDMPDACLGYELTQDLNFDTDGDGDVDDDDPNSFANFAPIGGSFAATFRGNGHTISNLTMEGMSVFTGFFGDVPVPQATGLFGQIASGATVRGLGLITPNVRQSGTNADTAGALAGENRGNVIGCYAIGGTVTVTHRTMNAGGLVGLGLGVVRTSYSTVAVSNGGQPVTTGAVGGLTGVMRDTFTAGTVQNSYAAGTVTAAGNAYGGLTGNGTRGTIITSYWDNEIVSASGASVSARLGMSTMHLQEPTAYTGIYSTWGDTDGDAWDFGTSTQYPVLKIDGHDPAVQRTSVADADGASQVGAPRVANAPGAVVLEVGGDARIDLSNAFTDPDGDALTYTAFTSNDAVVSARIEDGALLLGAGRAGSAEVMLVATDSSGLSASTTIMVDVVGNVSCTAELAQAAEGDTATAMAELTSPVTTPTTVRWRIVADADPTTADADAGDHGDASGEVVVAVGQRCAEIEIAILDDADAEPTREWFAVELQLRFPGALSLARRLVPVAVREGVCDRSPAVAESLLAATGLQSCDAPAATNLAGVQKLRLADAGLSSLATSDLEELAGLRTLDLSDNALNDLPSLSSLPRLERLLLSGNALAEVPEGLRSLERLLDLNLSANALSELPSDAFDGLSALRVLRLDGNQLATLPDGLFEGLSSLRLLRLDDNPGTPFALPVVVERTDAEPWASSPARLRVMTPLGAPFDMTVGLSAQGGVFADGAATAETVVPAGEVASSSHLLLSSATGFAQVSPTPPSLPSRLCLGQPCWRGFEFVMGEPLALFVRPLEVLSAPEPEPLFGDALRLPLTSLVAAGDASASGELTWRASSSDESVAEVRIVDDTLVVEAIAGAEGMVLVEATATDALGQMATVYFEVQVDFHWRTSHTRGWRSAISPD